jgi:hypothetical protein
MNTTTGVFQILFVLVTPLSSLSLEYSETTGAKTSSFTETIVSSCNEKTIRFENKDEICSADAFNDNNVYRCEIINKKDSNKVTAVRTGKLVEINVNGKVFKKELDNAPWYTSMNQLSVFALGKEAKVEYWVLSVDYDKISSPEKSFIMMKFLATKKGAEKIVCGHDSLETLKVIVTFTDWKSLFWKAQYWFRLSDGKMVRSEMARGGPGTPVTVVELVKE